jgi:hypothetical protein
MSIIPDHPATGARTRRLLTVALASSAAATGAFYLSWALALFTFGGAR